MNILMLRFKKIFFFKGRSQKLKNEYLLIDYQIRNMQCFFLI